MAADFAYDYNYSAAPEFAPGGAPSKKPQQKREPERAPLYAMEKQKVDEVALSRKNNLLVIKAFAVIVFAVSLLAVFFSSLSAVRDERISMQQNQKTLAIYQSQQVEVNAKLGNLVTPDKIAKIAVEKLGMVKLSDENKRYVSSEGENQIIISAEKN